MGGNQGPSSSKVTLLAGITLLLLTAGFVVPGEAFSYPKHETVDHYQSAGGDWYVLEARDCGFGCEDVARVHVYDSQWEEKTVISIPAPNTSEDVPRVEAFEPAGEGWWLERENGSYVRASGDGMEPESRRHYAPPGFHGEDERVGRDAVEVDTEITDGSVSNVYRGEDGFLWALSTAGRIYKYTAYGQYTGISYEAGNGTGDVGGYGVTFLVALVVGGFSLLASALPVALEVRRGVRERGSLTREYTAFAAASYLGAYLFLWYPLGPPLARIYWIPDQLLAAGMLCIVAVEALAIVRLRRGSIRWFDLPYLAIANNAMLFTVWILVH